MEDLKQKNPNSITSLSCTAFHWKKDLRSLTVGRRGGGGLVNTLTKSSMLPQPPPEKLNVPSLTFQIGGRHFIKGFNSIECIKVQWYSAPRAKKSASQTEENQFAR